MCGGVPSPQVLLSKLSKNTAPRPSKLVPPIGLAKINRTLTFEAFTQNCNIVSSLGGSNQYRRWAPLAQA
jgi:hypothetical protein